MKRFALLAALAACGGNTDRTAWLGTMDTLPNGVIVVSNPAAGLWDSATAWTFHEELIIGSELDTLNLLSQVTGLEADSSGRVYVLERSIPAVLVYDPAGKLIRKIGREGDGPGEFREPSGLGLDGMGRLWVVEGSHQRWSTFDRDGHHIATRQRPTGSYGYYWSGKFLDTGALIDQLDGRDASGHTQPLLGRYDSLRGMVDTLPLPYTLTGDNNYKLVHANGYSVMAIPYYPSYWNSIDPRGYVWVGNTGSYQLTQLNMKGDTVRIIRKESAGVPVTGAERDSAIALVRKVAEGASFDEGRIPRVKPVLERVLVDDSGYVYAMTPEPTGTTFDVFDPNGRYLGGMHTPRRVGPWRQLAPMIVKRGKMWAVVVDEDDVPRVVQWRVGS
ncbi:MAG: 6-bladed beta-propeller [Gemmatimonadota bacterium]